jgi:general secretion pathway protein D
MTFLARQPIQHTRASRSAIFIRTLFSVLLLSFGVVVSGVAQSIEPLKVTAQFDVTSNTLVLKAPQSIRYRIDSSERRLRVLNAVLDEKSRAQLPDPTILKFSSEQDTLVFTFAYSFDVSLTGDGQILTATPTKVVTTNPAESDNRFPLTISLANADPQFVAGILTRAYGFKVEVDPRRKAVLVFVGREDWAFVRAVVNTLDEPRPQVVFEAEILEINSTLSQSLGINYRDLFNFTLTELNPPSLLELGDISRTPLNVKIGLDLLKTTGTATVLARPRVTTLDGVEARLNSTQTTSQVITNNNNQTVVNTTTGITLRLLPRVAPDNQIEASINVAVSSPSGERSFSTRDASTTVRVSPGEPIVIGGLFEHQQSVETSGIPGLMDIPYLGELFKSTTTLQRNTDLVIVVTPYLILPKIKQEPVPVPVPVPPTEQP